VTEIMYARLFLFGGRGFLLFQAKKSFARAKPESWLTSGGGGPFEHAPQHSLFFGYVSLADCFFLGPGRPAGLILSRIGVSVQRPFFYPTVVSAYAVNLFFPTQSLWSCSIPFSQSCLSAPKHDFTRALPRRLLGRSFDVFYSFCLHFFPSSPRGFAGKFSRRASKPRFPEVAESSLPHSFSVCICVIGHFF